MKQAATLCLLVLSACSGGSSSSGSAPSATASASAALVAASASAASPVTTAAATVPEAAAPKGSGVSELKPLGEVADCKMKSAELANYLQRPGIGLAGRAADGAFASVWLVELQNNPDAQIAFAGFDAEGRQVARARSIGSTRSEGLRVFDTSGAWAVTWFDAEGLTHARPRWEATPPPEIQHLTTVGKEASDNVAIASTTSGALVAAAPFGPQRDQLGVFLFAPTDSSQPSVKAVGVTHYAKQARRPAVAADATGYYLAWHEEDGSIHASRFDANGKEGDAHVLAPEGPKRERVALAVTNGGALALWAEGETLIARGLDASAKPAGPAWVVGKGKWATFTAAGPGALVAWVGNDGKSDGQLLVARLGPDGAPSAQGLRVTDGAGPVKDPPAVAVAGTRAGLAWTETMSPTVSTKRAVLRVLEVACVP